VTTRRALVGIAVAAALGGCSRPARPAPGCDPAVYTWIYARPSAPRRMDVYRWAGGTETALTRDRSSGAPTVSPDGRRVVFTRGLGGWSDDLGFERYQLYAMEPDGKRQRPFLGGGQDQFPAFAPDGSAVAFLRGAGERTALMVVPAGGGTPREVAGADPLSTAPPAWSADGGLLAWVRVPPSSGGDQASSVIAWSRPDGTGRGSVRVAGDADGAPVFTADGTGFVLSMSTTLTGPIRPYRVDRQTGAATALATGTEVEAITRLPAGRLAGFALDRRQQPRNPRLVVFDPDGRHLTTVAKVPISFPYNDMTLAAVPAASCAPS
jgi:Tol biopolymer transport system component